MNIENIQALIANGLIAQGAQLNPAETFLQIGVFQPGNRPKGSGNANTYKAYAISLDQITGTAYTASNGIALIGNDFQLASNLISQFTNDTGYITSGGGTTDLDPVISQTNVVPGSPVSGDRYLAGTTPGAPWIVNSIEEWNGASWVTTAPVLDDVVFITSTLSTLRYNGSAWVAYVGTAVLNQGNSTGSTLVIGTNTPQALAFKTNNVETARVVSGGSWGFGTITPSAKVTVKGQGSTSATMAFDVRNSSNTLILAVRNDGNVGIGITTPTAKLYIKSPDDTIGNFGIVWANNTGTRGLSLDNDGSLLVNGRQTITWANGASFTAFDVNAQSAQIFNIQGGGTGTVCVGTGVASSDTILHVKGKDATSSNYALKVDNSASSPLLYVKNDGFSSFNGISSSIGSVEAHGTNMHGFVSVVNGTDNAYSGLGITDGGTWFFRANKSGEIQINSSQNSFFIGNGNIGLGTSTISAKLHIQGIDATSSNYALKVDNSASSPLLYVRNDGNIGIGTTTITNKLTLFDNSFTSSQLFINAGTNQGALSFLAFGQGNNQIFFDANYESSSLIAKSTTPSAIVHYLDNLRFNGNIGATVGASFSYNTLMGLNFTTGNLSVGLGISAALARIHNYGIDSTTKVNQRLEPVANVTEDTTGNTVNTTDATANVTAQTIAVPTDKVISIESTIVYRKTGGAGVGTTGDGTTIKLNSSVKNAGGTLTLDTVQNTYTGTTNAIVGVSATYTISGTNVLVSVTGVLDDNITWNVITKVNTVA